MDVGQTIQGKPVFTGNVVKAQYNPEEEAMYKHNAFIEALPPIRSEELVARMMRRQPAYHDNERHWAAHRRLQAVQTIANFLEPLPIHLDLEQRFSRMIRNGYMARNPLSAEWVKQLRSGFPNIFWDEKNDDYVPIIRSTAAGFTIIGTSGIGKTTAIESVLSMYPQVIIHTEYKNNAFDRKQLVWLKLDCTPDGSIKGLCLNFFQAIDTILGTNYYRKFGHSRRTVDELLPTMAMLASALGIGVLVIDEIQRLSLAKSGGAEKMLNFFVQLINTIGVPVVLIGTFKAMQLMTKEFSQARRSAGQGDLVWSNLPNDEFWDFFTECLWEYQWTNVPTKLTQDLKDVLYDESQGITDIAVKLYMLAQWSVIGQADERLTPRLIRHIANESLSLCKPILDALRSRDMTKLSQISDVYPPTDELDKFFHSAVERVRVEGTLHTLRNQRKANRNSDEEDNPVLQIAKWLITAGVEPTLARQCAVKSVEHYGTNYDLQTAMKAAFSLAMSGELQAPKKSVEMKQGQKKKRTKLENIYFPEDIRKYVADGTEKGINAFQSLTEAGIIKQADEFISKKVKGTP
ncbi:ATP-binding protein [Brevibacillus nitrificans]|uniref:ATP-binding protein n=2 Tax=Brevibacillus nitrificans TaxID=651560 RepID=A0A3M8D276_9BACL|nr:ATP-binding protein [Brevibacillus nitrificans]